MSNGRKTIELSLAFLTALFSMMPTTGTAQSAKDSETVSALLVQAKTVAFELKQDAGEMNTFVRSKSSWQTHAVKLDQIKRHVNTLGELLARMDRTKPTAAPWQQQLIDRVTPLLRDLATSVTATIKHLSDNQDRLLHPPYPAYAAANADYASDISQLISDSIAYGEDKHKAEDLGRESEIAGQ
jgi:hypothetical protein